MNQGQVQLQQQLQPLPVAAQPLQAPQPHTQEQQQLITEQQQQLHKRQQRLQAKPWEQYSHPADRIAIRLSVAFQKAKARGLLRVRNPYKVVKARRKQKKETKRSEYRQRMQALLEQRGWPLAQEHHEEVVQLLRKKPFLAGEAFQESVSGHSTSPLSYLIAGMVGIDVVKEIYNLSPEAIYRTWPEDTYPPLMGACHSGVSHEVIAFLVDEFPGSLYKKDFDGSLPINIYMRRAPQGPSYDVIRQMVDLYPESIIADDRIGWGLSPIDYALRLDFDVRILEYFVEQWPQEENDYGLFWDSNSDFYPDTISMERIEVLMKLLPELDYFHSFIDEWEAEGLIYVMDCLRENTTVVDLCLRVPCRTMLSDPKVAEALVLLLRKNKRIQKLTLLGTRNQMRQGTVDDSYFSLVLDALEDNPNLKELNLSDFNLTSGDRLGEYFLSGAAPRILTFTDVYVKDAWIPFTSEQKCRVEKFTISYCNIYSAWYQGFLNQLQSLTSLKEFILHNGTNLNLNVTTLMVDVLTHSPLLSIKITGYQVHMRRVAEALRHNKHLIKYSAENSVNLEWKRALVAEIMEEDNTTLEWVDLPEIQARNAIQGQQLAYFSLLNQYGRTKMRSTTDGTNFCKLLIDVNEDTGTLQEIAQHNVLYGLLQEMPGIWSGRNFSSASQPLVAAISSRSLSLTVSSKADAEKGGFEEIVEV